MAPVCVPDNFAVKFAVMLVSTVFVALGVFLYVAPRFVPLAPEGFIIALTQVTKASFSKAVLQRPPLLRRPLWRLSYR